MISGLAIDGGGVCGIAHIGALEVLDIKGVLEGIKYFAGSSAGSIIAAALGCKISVQKLKDEIYTLDFNKFKDDSFGFIRDIYRLIHEYGWYKGEALEEWFGNFMERCGIDKNITLKGVYDKFGTHVIITTVCVNDNKCIYMDHLTHPTTKLKFAVHKSSCIPIFFKAAVENNKYYIDGGTLDNYPIRSLYNYIPKEQVIGIKLMTVNELTEMNYSSCLDLTNPLNDDNTPPSLIEYIKILITLIHNQALKIHIHDEDWNRTIKVNVGTITSTQFNLTTSEKQFLIKNGADGALDFLSSL